MALVLTLSLRFKSIYILLIFITFIMTKILIEMEGPLHKALKIRAIEKGISMAEAVIEGIEWYVDSEREEAIKVEGEEGEEN